LITETTIQETAVTGVLANNRTGGAPGKKTRQSETPNQMVWLPRSQQKL
jgi:hypothetical protein